MIRRSLAFAFLGLFVSTLALAEVPEQEPAAPAPAAVAPADQPAERMPAGRALRLLLSPRLGEFPSLYIPPSARNLAAPSALSPELMLGLAGTADHRSSWR